MSRRTKGETCESVLLKYLTTCNGWVRKVDLYRPAEDWSPETVGRALRALQEEGKIFVDYYDGRIAKNLAMYSYIPKQPEQKTIYEIIEVDGIRKAVIKQ